MNDRIDSATDQNNNDAFNFFQALPLFESAADLNRQSLPEFLFRKFSWKNAEYELMIHPAQLAGEPQEKFFYPGAAENAVIGAVRELASPDNPFYASAECTIYFTLDQLMNHLPEEFTGDQIEQAIAVLAHAPYEIIRGDRRFSFFFFTSLSSRKIDNAMCYKIKLNDMPAVDAWLTGELFQ